MRRFFALTAAAAVLAGCGGSDPPAPPVEDAAQQLVRQGASSAVVLVADGGRTYVAADGANPEARFRIGSVTKTFTAAVVLQLVDEGKLRLADPVARYLPGLVPAARQITIRDLLNHRSGLVNFTDFGTWMAQAEQSSTTRPRDAVRFAASHEPAFRAGSRWSYSNTNYIALGLVIEKVTARSLGSELERRIIEPLELEDTELATTRRPAGLDDPGTNPNLPWAAGGIVSTAQDLARFHSALMSGKVVSPESLFAMKQTVETGGEVEDGLGMFASKLPCGRFWGHDGGILDYTTQVAASEDGERVAVILARLTPSFFGRPPLEDVLCPAKGA
jgi:D-alanyl-D-alanine carboxypeptidase